MKRFFRIAGTITVLAIILLIISCTGNNDNKTLVVNELENSDSVTITYISFYNESGTVPVDKNVYHYGDTVTVLGNTGSLYRSGYDFDGWSTSPDGYEDKEGKSTRYKPGDTIIVKENVKEIVLYVQWAKYHIVSFNTNGKGVTPEPQIVRDGDCVTPPDDQIDGDYQLLGNSSWYIYRMDDNGELTKSYYFRLSEQPIHSDVILYAEWKKISFFVSFHALNYFEHFTVEVGDFIVPPEVPKDLPAEDGDVFEWFYWKPDGGTEPFDFSKPVTKALQNMTDKYGFLRFLGEYRKNNNTVTFNTKGYGITPESQVIDVGGTAQEPSEPYAEDFIFEGWYTDFECTIAFDFSTSINEDITLYAKWTPVTYYTVSFSSSGFGNEPESQRVKEGNLAVEPEKPIVDNFIFEGWYLNQEFTEVYDFETPVTADIWLYAKFVRGSSVNLTVKIQTESDINITQSYDGSFLILTAEEGFDSYIWKLDGTVLSEKTNVLTVDKSELVSGTYSIVLKAKKGSDYKSAIIYVKKEAE